MNKLLHIEANDWFISYTFFNLIGQKYNLNTLNCDAFFLKIISGSRDFFPLYAITKR